MHDETKSPDALAHEALVPRKARSLVETQRSVIVEVLGSADARPVPFGDASCTKASIQSEDEVTSVSRMTRGIAGRRVLWFIGYVEANRVTSLVLALGVVLVIAALLGLLQHR